MVAVYVFTTRSTVKPFFLCRTLIIPSDERFYVLP
jgi:hypothetical protein